MLNDSKFNRLQNYSKLTFGSDSQNNLINDENINSINIDVHNSKNATMFE